VCILIVAAFQAPFAGAASPVDDVPVPGSTIAFARSLGIDPVPDRARFIHEVTRLVYDTSDFRPPAVAAFLQSIRQPPKNAPSPIGRPNAADAVPVPLAAHIWSDAVFRRRVERDDLIVAIVADRQASLLCHGLTKLDDATLEYFSAHAGLLTRIYERSAPLFAAYAASIRIRDNRVIPPGDPDSVPLWEAVVNERVTRADRFVSALFEINDGRVAYLYDTIGQSDAPRRAFLLGSTLPDDAVRLERFRMLATAAVGAIREWHVRTLPFGRSSFDLGMALVRMAFDPAGRPLPPASRGLWARVFNMPEAADDLPIDAMWLVETVLTSDVRLRGERLDQLTFAQRVFGASAADRVEQAFVLRSMPRFRALLLTLERAGIRSAATYAAVVRHAGKLSGLDGRRGYVAQAQLQSSLAILTRMAAVGTLDTPTVDRLIGQLVALPLTDGAGYAGGVARWLREELHPLMPKARDIDGAIVAGLSGRAGGRDRAPRVVWEGQRYVLDLAASERQRLQRVREKQAAPAIDLPLQLAEIARLLKSDKVTADDITDSATQLSAMLADLPEKSREEQADDLPVGVGLPPPLHETLKRAAADLAKEARGRDLKRVARIAEPIADLGDDLLARNLLSFAYAISLGDSDGTILLADDVSHRHDFGFALKDSEMRARLAWAVPRQEVSPGVPWHVSGSVLGLDIALATLSLRRVATDHMLEAPKLTSNARDTFASSVSLMDPLAMSDSQRDAIAMAIHRGTARLATADAEALERIAADLSLDAARQRAMRWALAHGTPELQSMLSMTELLALGGGNVAELQPWGMSVVSVNGCFCTRLLPAGVWPTLSGRPQLGLTAAVLPDVNLRVAIVLKELDLPAALAKVVLAAAMQDFIDEVRPTDDSDWLSLSRAARTISRVRVEDYVAAATATGPLMPDSTRTPDGPR
jgi:hypothetical protein